MTGPHLTPEREAEIRLSREQAETVRRALDLAIEQFGAWSWLTAARAVLDEATA